MKNFEQDGDTLDLIAPSGGVVAGGFYLIGALFVVACVTAAEGATFAAARCGVYNSAPKATGAAWAQGDKLYWDNSTKVFTKTASGNTYVAVATKAAASGDAVGTVLLTEYVA